MFEKFLAFLSFEVDYARKRILNEVTFLAEISEANSFKNLFEKL
jgi:hypothetical protein